MFSNETRHICQSRRIACDDQEQNDTSTNEENSSDPVVLPARKRPCSKQKIEFLAGHSVPRLCRILGPSSRRTKETIQGLICRNLSHGGLSSTMAMRQKARHVVLNLVISPRIVEQSHASNTPCTKRPFFFLCQWLWRHSTHIRPTWQDSVAVPGAASSEQYGPEAPGERR